MSFHYSPKPIIDNNLILYLDAANSKSYSGVGTTITDLSRTFNNGSSSFFPTYNSVDGGGSLVFDGINSRIQTLTSPTLTNQITFEVWFKTLNVANSQPPPGFGVGFLGGSENRYRMIVTTTNVNWVCATVNNSWYSTGTHEANINFQSSSGVWFQVVGVYNGTRNIVYLNGGSSVNINPNTISGNIISSTQFGIGYPVGFVPGGNTINAFNGSIGLVRIYNRALSQSEILQNYNANKSRFNIN